MMNASFSDRGREHRFEAVPPGTYCLVADIDAAFVEKILDLSWRQRKANIHHHGKADNFGRCLEVSERISHSQTLRDVLSALKQYCPDTACKGDTVPLAVGQWYDFHEFGWYLGNVG